MPAKDSEEREGELGCVPASLSSHPCLGTMYTLPSDPRPNHYSIIVSFDIPRRVFRCSLEITLMFERPTHTIFLNSQSLQLCNIKLKNDKTGAVIVGEVTEKEDTIGVIRIDFCEEICSGQHTLALDCSGAIRNGLQGVYLNKFIDLEGKERDGVSTMFAATEARSFIPCWDQPNVKCTFGLRVAAVKGLQVLSNMEELDTVDEWAGVSHHVLPDAVRDAWVCHRFSDSPKMSTYLLCLVIGQYCSTDRMAGNTRISVHSPTNRPSEGMFAVETAVKCVLIFNDFFGLPYCLPKLDLVGVACLSVGAMENWGLVTFRENSLLVDQATASNAQLQAVATIVAHEVSHQWFGNLVTMDWWSDLWLNEGFATFMQYYAVDRVWPKFKLWDQFASDVLIPSLQLDALENSHPVKVAVRNPREIDEVFDKISYRKGASLIRMLHSVMGEEAFQVGIRSYMTSYSYSNATTGELWASLSAASPGLDVADMMNCWVDNVGFPILKVSLVRRQGQAQPTILITQERFSAAHRCNDGLIWRVPILVSVRGSLGQTMTLPVTLLTEKTVELSIQDLEFDLDRGSYVKMNPGFVSYYRSDYSRELHTALESAMCEGNLSPVDRLSTLEDRVSLVLGEQGNTVALMRLIAKLDKEDSFLVWKNLSSFFHVLRCIVWSSEQMAARFDKFVVSAMLPCLERIGWSRVAGESHLTSMLRGLLICQLGTRGCALVEERCGSLFSGWVGEDACEVEPGLREVVMKVAMASRQPGGGHTAMESLITLLEVPQERNRVLHSLGYSSNKDVLARVLSFSLDPRLRDQESVMVLESVCQNRIGVRLAWDFFKEHLKDFFSRYGHGLFLMSKLIKCVTENFSTEEELTEVSEFFRIHPEIGCERTIRQAKENISLNLYWKNRDMDSVARFLESSIE